MDKFGDDMKKAAAKMSGVEMMLRSVGMGQVLDMAKSLATDGTFQKIISFAEKADQFQKTLERMERALHDREQADCPHCRGLRGSETQPGSGADAQDGEHGQLAPRPVLVLSQSDGHTGRSHSNGAAS